MSDSFNFSTDVSVSEGGILLILKGLMGVCKNGNRFEFACHGHDSGNYQHKLNIEIGSVNKFGEYEKEDSIKIPSQLPRTIEFYKSPQGSDNAQIYPFNRRDPRSFTRIINIRDEHRKKGETIRIKPNVALPGIQLRKFNHNIIVKTGWLFNYALTNSTFKLKKGENSIRSETVSIAIGCNIPLVDSEKGVLKFGNATPELIELTNEADKLWVVTFNNYCRGNTEDDFHLNYENLIDKSGSGISAGFELEMDADIPGGAFFGPYFPQNKTDIKITDSGVDLNKVGLNDYKYPCSGTYYEEDPPGWG